MTTLSKASLGEALAALDESAKIEWVRTDHFVEVEAAARFVERLLPELCQNTHLKPDTRCPVCHGTGQVWDEGLVEVVALAISEVLYQVVSVELEPSQYLRARDEMARAVLAAFAGEVGK